MLLIIQYKTYHPEFQRLNVATSFRMWCDIIGMCSNTIITAVFNELTDVFRALLEILSCARKLELAFCVNLHV